MKTCPKCNGQMMLEYDVDKSIDVQNNKPAEERQWNCLQCGFTLYPKSYKVLGKPVIPGKQYRKTKHG